MKNIIYYFSGTGNSLRAAETIAEKIGGAVLYSVRCDPEQVSARDADMIGFVCPVYEWDVPGSFKTFISELYINPDAYIELGSNAHMTKDQFLKMTSIPFTEVLTDLFLYAVIHTDNTDQKSAT